MSSSSLIVWFPLLWSWPDDPHPRGERARPVEIWPVPGVQVCRALILLAGGPRRARARRPDPCPGLVWLDAVAADQVRERRAARMRCVEGERGDGLPGSSLAHR